MKSIIALALVQVAFMTVSHAKLSVEYVTVATNDCAEGYIDGPFTNAQGSDVKWCFLKKQIKNKYITDVKNKCIKGFTDGDSANSQGYKSKWCLKK